MRRLIVFEDEHLLVIRKPAGINTHASGPFAGEGVYDWLRRREPRWSNLAIIQRLDKETSGIVVFANSPRANASLTKQFSRRRVSKEYVFLTDREPRSAEFRVRSWIRKGRGRFESVSQPDGGLEAETTFDVVGQETRGWRVRAVPHTGRTHQIRLHAAQEGIPILGDVLYGGTVHARLCLHARSLRFRHPASNAELEFVEEPDFDAPAAEALRAAFVDLEATSAYRLRHGSADGHPGWYVDRLGDFLLASIEGEPPETPPSWLEALGETLGVRGIYRRSLDRHLRGALKEEVSPQLYRGEPAPAEFEVTENGLKYLLSFSEGHSIGLFLDQRDNRRRLMINWVGPEFPVREAGLAGAEVLNVFAYTCGFSVAAASAGATTTSLDLSRKYLEWGRRQFLVNGLDPAAHDFIYGDALEWMRRLAKRGRRFDVVLLDPPTFSQSRERGIFRVEKDYGELVEAAAGLLRPRGVLFASTNTARLEPESFVKTVLESLAKAGRGVESQLFVPQPPDFPTTRDEPGFLKTFWVRVS